MCAAVVWGLFRSLPGQVLRAIKENEQRVGVLGLNPHLFKLLAFVTAGRRWGAVLGGALNAYASQTLTRLSGSAAVAGLPGFVRGPIAQPLFLLGGAFVVIAFFIPVGLATLPGRISQLARRGKAARRHG